MTPGKISESFTEQIWTILPKYRGNIEEKDKRVKGMSGRVLDTDDKRSEFFFKRKRAVLENNTKQC